MFENCTMLPTAGMSRSDWLAERRKGIGGSDAAAIIGLNRWETPYTIYLDKLGLLQEKEESEAMRQGRDFEDYVAKRFTEETSKKVQKCNYMIQNPAYPWAIADIDRRVVGENAGLECKTTSTLDLKQFRGVEFPEKYYVQCVHYLAVTGADRWYLAVLVFGKEFHVYTLERDESEIAALMAAEAEFWEKVKNEIPPDITGQEADTKAVTAIFPDSIDEEIDLYDAEDLFKQLKSADDYLKNAQAWKDRVVNQIKDRMKTASVGNCGTYSCTWKTQERRTVDIAALKEAYPDIPIDQFTKTSKSRPFRWKEAKE